MLYVYDRLAYLKLDLLDLDRMLDFETQKTLKTEITLDDRQNAFYEDEPTAFIK